MKIGPLYYYLYPELKLFPSDTERLETLLRIHKDITRRRRSWLASLTIMAVMIGAIALNHFFFIPLIFRVASLVPRQLAIILVLISPVAAGVAGLLLLFNYVHRRPIQRGLRQRLQELGVPICVACSYDLRGQTEPRCPECAEPFDLDRFQPKSQLRQASSESRQTSASSELCDRE